MTCNNVHYLANIDSYTLILINYMCMGIGINILHLYTSGPYYVF